MIALADAIRPWSPSETVEGSAGCYWELISDALADAIRPWSRSDPVVGAEGPSAIEGLNRGSGRSEPFGRAPTDASLPIGVLQATATLYGPGRGVSGIIIETNRDQSPYYLFVPVPPRWTIRVGGRAHITRERQSELIPLSARKNNRRPPSWRSPPLWDRGGSTLNPLGLCNRASLSVKAGPRHMKGRPNLELRTPCTVA